MSIIPDHRPLPNLGFGLHVKEQIDSRLFICVQQTVVVIAFDILQEIPGMTAPLPRFCMTIRIHTINQGGPSILPCQGVTMIMVHLDQHIDDVAIEIEVGRVDDA